MSHECATWSVRGFYTVELGRASLMLSGTHPRPHPSPALRVLNVKSELLNRMLSTRRRRV